MNKAYHTDGRPKYVACFHNPKATIDEYECQFTYINRIFPDLKGRIYGLSMNKYGYYYHFEYEGRLTGKRINFADMPIECQQTVMAEYEELYGKF